jgi:hypothetical protein
MVVCRTMRDRVGRTFLSDAINSREAAGADYHEREGITLSRANRCKR